MRNKINAMKFSIVLFFAMFLIFGLVGLNTSHSIAGYALMACSGFFGGGVVSMLVIRWFYNSSAKSKHVQRISIVLSGLLCLILGAVSLYDPVIEAGRVIMAGAGFFAWIALFIPAISGFLYKHEDNESR